MKYIWRITSYYFANIEIVSDSLEKRIIKRMSFRLFCFLTIHSFCRRANQRSSRLNKQSNAIEELKCMPTYAFSFIRNFRSGMERFTSPSTRVFVSPSFPRPFLSLMCSVLFFPFLQSLAQKFDTRFSLRFDHRVAFHPVPPLSCDVFYYFSIILYPSRLCPRLLYVVFTSPAPLPCCGTVKKNSQTSFADRRLFYRSSFYLIRRILASYHVRGDVKANEVRLYVADVNPLPYVCTLG